MNWENSSMKYKYQGLSITPLPALFAVSCRSDSISKVTFICCHKSDAWSHFKQYHQHRKRYYRQNNQETHCCQQGTCRTKIGPLRNISIDRVFLRRLSIQNHLKSSITKKIQRKAKYLTRNSITLTFMKKTSMSNPIECLNQIWQLQQPQTQ